MGIKGLNSFIQANCSVDIKQITLWELKGKTIAVDSMIYLYRFKSEGGLVEGMYQMVSLMKYYGVNPIFVFDGKPPPEKLETIRKRKEEKHEAEIMCKTVQRQLSEAESRSEDTTDLQAEVDRLRRQFVRITYQDIAEVKELMQSMGVSYYEADGESDGVCARMVHKKVAYACLSEDMDMFVYGCSRVLRYLSLLKSTVVLYDLNAILRTLNITFADFKSICVLAGTDYSEETGTRCDLNRALKAYAKFAKQKETIEFYDWLELWKADDADYDALRRVYDMFSVCNVNIQKDNLVESRPDREAMESILRPYGFVF